MAVILTKVEIDSVDVTSKLLSWKIERTFGNAVSITELKFANSVSTLKTPENGHKLEIWRGFTTATDKKEFSGFVEVVTSGIGKLTVVGKDNFYDLIRREVTKSYDIAIDASAGVASEIWKDLVTTFGGLTADGTTVQSTGTVNTLDKFICDHDDVFERCKKLADLYDYQQYYRADTDKAYFEPKGFLSNSLILTVGGNVLTVPKWVRDEQQMINEITIIGARQEVETTEKFDGTGAQTTFTLTKRPISVKVFVGGTLQVPGKTGATSGSFDYTVDAENNQIIFESGSIPPSGTNNVDVEYSYGIPTPVTGENASSKKTYGIYRRTFIESDIVNVTDAEVRAQQVLDKYSTPFISAEGIKVKIDASSALLPGQIINVVDNISVPNVNSNVVINKQILLFPSQFDEVSVGDKQWRLADWQANIAERLAKLEQSLTKDQDVLLHVVNAASDFEFDRFSLTVESQVINDSFILGHPVNGRLGVVSGTQPVLGDQRSAPVTEYTVTY